MVRIFRIYSLQFSSVAQLCSTFATPWIAARQASLSITNSWSLLKLMSIESVMPSSHLILCRPLLFLPPVPPSTKVFSNESTLLMSVYSVRSFQIFHAAVWTRVILVHYWPLLVIVHYILNTYLSHNWKSVLQHLHLIPSPPTFYVW